MIEVREGVGWRGSCVMVGLAMLWGALRMLGSASVGVSLAASRPSYVPLPSSSSLPSLPFLCTRISIVINAYDVRAFHRGHVAAVASLRAALPLIASITLLSLTSTPLPPSLHR